MKITQNNIDPLVYSLILVVSLSAGLTSIKPSLAQSNIAPDNTLGADKSQIVPNVNNKNGIPSILIEGGAERGKNLFHSFEEFNISEGRGAYFLVPNDAIENVLTRVTGNNPSAINGILGTISNGNFDPTSANLFLINPNGIIFGKNSSLDLNGSFVGTTANAVKFGSQGFFSATNPEQPIPVLAIDPSALLFNQLQSAPIQNNSRVPLGLIRKGLFNQERIGLRVPDGKSLLLVGGDINLDSAGLNAYEGRIELGAIASSGTVGMNINNQDIILNFPNDVPRGKITFTNESSVDVSGGDRGNIRIYARELNAADQTVIIAGIDNNFKEPKVGQAGNIDINVTDTIKLERRVLLQNSIGNSIGNAGNINIKTNRLQLEAAGEIQSDNSGAGKGGDINITAGDIVIDGVFKNESSGIFTRILGGNGEAGNININANSLSITNGAGLFTQAESNSQGKAGNVIINVPNGTVKISGGWSPETDDGTERSRGSGIFSFVQKDSIGSGGNIEIRAKEFLLLGDELKRDNIISAGLFTLNSGKGNAGNVTIEASDKIVIDGIRVRETAGGIFSINNSQEEAKGGDINLITNADGSIIIDNGNLLLASNFGIGNSGNINISTGQLLVKNNSLLLSQTDGIGDSGEINIKATHSVIFDNESQALNNIQSRGIGNAKNIIINTGELILSNKSLISAETFGQGNAGDVIINAPIGVTLNDGVIKARVSETSDLNGNVNQNGGGTGDAGDININTSKLHLTNQGQIAVSSTEQGTAGNININANSVNLSGINSPDGIVLNARTSSEVKGGGITINADTLELKDGGVITAQGELKGIAGDINIKVKDNFNADNGQIITQAEQSSGGEINITAGKNIILRNNSDIKTILSTTAGSGGDITLTANAIVALEDSDILAFAPEGSGGNITFNTLAFLSDPLYRPTAQTTDTATLNKLDGNNRSDVNASGLTRPGTVSVDEDSSFLQNSLTELAENPIDSEALIASSCVVRSKERNATFFITGGGGFPYHPGDALPSIYSALGVQPITDDTSDPKPRTGWKIGDPIVEPTGVYRLANGRRILSRECGN